MKPAHTHKDEKWKTGLNESPSLKGFRKFVCACAGRQEETKQLA